MWQRGALRSPDFRKLLFGLVVSKSGDWLYNVALQVYIFESTHSPAWVAAGSIVRLIPYAALGTLGGALADRYERRSLMIACDLVRAAVMAVLAAAAWLSGPPTLALALVFVASAAGSPYTPAMAAMTPRIVSEDDLAAANAAISTIDNVAVVAGPAVGGVLLLLGSPASAFGINALSFLVSALAVFLVSARSRGGLAESRSGFVAGLLEGWKTVAASAPIAAVIAFVAASGFIYGLDTVLLVLFSVNQLALSASGYGYLLAALGLGGVLGALATARLLRLPHAGFVLAGAVVTMGLPLALLAVVHNLVVAVALLVVQGAGNVAVDVLAFTLLQRSLSQNVIARVFGVLDSTAVAAMLLGAFLAPALVAIFGLRGSLLAGGLVLPGAVLALVPFIRRLSLAADETLEEIAPRIALLDRLRIFDGASRPAIELLAQALVEERVPPHAVVIRQGERATDFFVVVEGEVQVLSTGGRRGRPRPVNVMRAGDYFGEIGLVEGIARTATVQTLTECRLYRIRGADFLAAINGEGGVSVSLRDGIARRLERTHRGATLRPAASTPAQ